MSRYKAPTYGCVVLLILAVAALTQGQSSTTATLSGRITDQQGGVVPGATIEIINTDTNVSVTTKSNADGLYVVPYLHPGPYRVVVRKSGFEEIVRSGLTLQVQQVAAQNFVLSVGSLSQSIQVTGAAPVLQSQTASTGQVITHRSIITLPLNGRDYTQLVTLAAGAAPNNYYGRASDDFSLNGSETHQNVMQVDGIDNLDILFGTGNIKTVEVLQPSVDAIQEFKVETSNYSAEYGRAAGGIVTVAIKSGTNQFHGDAFEFLRNDAFDANDFFANAAGLPRPSLRRNQFGGTLGGPVIRNRSFFFVSYQGTREDSPATGATTVPTPAMVSGDFGSTPIYDPLDVVKGVRQEFRGNMIPPSRMDPVAVKMAGLYPAPNLPGAVNNFAYSQRQISNAGELDSRFDEQLSTRDSAFVGYSRGTSKVADSSIFGNPGNGGANTDLPKINYPEAYAITIGETHIFSPSVINEFHAGYTRAYSNPDSPATQPLFQQFGFKGIPPEPGLTGLPTISITGFSSLGDGNSIPNPKLSQVTQVRDSVSWIRGNHTLKLGGEVVLTHNFAATQNETRGDFTFSGQFTSQVAGKGKGSGFGDFLLGQTSAAQLTGIEQGRLRYPYYGLFANDTWRISRKLTATLGIRYDLQYPLYDRDNHLANFDYDSTSADFGALVVAKNGSTLSRSFSNLDTDNFAPRLGLAYEIGAKTVIRAAFGTFYGGLGYLASNNSDLVNLPYNVDITLQSATTAAASSLVLSNGFPAGFLTPVIANNPSAYSLSANYPMPAVYQWNVAAQRELPGSSSLTVAYVGSSTSDLAGYNQINEPPPGPGAINPRRPFSNFGDIIYDSPYAHATYHALQVTYERRFLNGFSLLSDYTWSHELDNALTGENVTGETTPQNPADTAVEKAPAGFDIRQRFVTSGIYQLPLGRAGKPFGRSALSRAILGGWELGPIFVAQGGFPLTPVVSPSPANTTTPARPDRLCDGNLPRGQRTVNLWYDVGCFVPAAPFTFGNSARRVVRGPGLVNLDLLVDRSFRFTESKSLEFRAEFFNFTNTAHFDAPDMTINIAQAGSITSDLSPNREIQFALRFRF